MLDRVQDELSLAQVGRYCSLIAAGFWLCPVCNRRLGRWWKPSGTTRSRFCDSLLRPFLALLAAAATIVIWNGSTSARPFRGTTKVYVVLCQTSDSGAAPRTLDHYRNLL